jgi:hypothetical protein
VETVKKSPSNGEPLRISNQKMLSKTKNLQTAVQWIQTTQNIFNGIKKTTPKD